MTKWQKYKLARDIKRSLRNGTYQMPEEVEVEPYDYQSDYNQALQRAEQLWNYDDNESLWSQPLDNYDWLDYSEPTGPTPEEERAVREASWDLAASYIYKKGVDENGRKLNGQYRKDWLSNAGYSEEDIKEIQKRLNQMYYGTRKPTTEDDYAELVKQWEKIYPSENAHLMAAAERMYNKAQNPNTPWWKKIANYIGSSTNSVGANATTMLKLKGGYLTNKYQSGTGEEGMTYAPAKQSRGGRMGRFAKGGKIRKTYLDVMFK